MNFRGDDVSFGDFSMFSVSTIITLREVSDVFCTHLVLGWWDVQANKIDCTPTMHLALLSAEWAGELIFSESTKGKSRNQHISDNDK